MQKLPDPNSFPLRYNKLQIHANVVEKKFAATLGEAEQSQQSWLEKPEIVRNGRSAVPEGVGAARVVEGNIDAHAHGFEPGPAHC